MTIGFFLRIDLLLQAQVLSVHQIEFAHQIGFELRENIVNAKTHVAWQALRCRRRIRRHSI